MSEVLFTQGAVWKQTNKNSQNKTHIASLSDALEELAKCAACACSTCFGYSTHTNAETGDLMVTWITGTGVGEDGFVVNVGLFDEEIAGIKALKTART